MRLLAWLWNGVRGLIGLVLPVFSKARDFRGLGPGGRWVLRLVLLAAILVGLYFLNPYLGVPGLLKTGVSPVIRSVWLPILGLLVILLCWLGWWVYQLLKPEYTQSEFPDIDDAWDAAMHSLGQAGIDPRDAPLFLVLGRPEGGEDAFFKAAQLALQVRGAPPGGDQPLHVYANQEGVYVTCAGASLLGRLAALLAGKAEAGPALTSSAHDNGNGSPAIDPLATLAAGRQKDKKVDELKAILDEAERQGRGPAQLTVEEQRRVRVLAKSRPVLLTNRDEVERLTARLKYLCRLIVRDRYPYCPVNGILVLLPLAATDDDEEARQASTLGQTDMAAAHEALQVHCPSFALVCDLESATGVREFLDRFPKDSLQRRLGQRFPLAPDLDPAAQAALVDKGGNWICNSLLPFWIYKLFRVESPREGSADAIEGNARLYRFLYEMRERQKRLGLIASRLAPQTPNMPLLFGGCYLGCTGSDPSGQAFLPGVLRRLVDEQEAVCWTQQALDEEQEYRRWTRVGYTVVGLFTAAILALDAYLLFWKSGNN
jgi:hypothetical protein